MITGLFLLTVSFIFLPGNAFSVFGAAAKYPNSRNSAWFLENFSISLLGFGVSFIMVATLPYMEKVVMRDKGREKREKKAQLERGEGEEKELFQGERSEGTQEFDEKSERMIHEEGKEDEEGFHEKVGTGNEGDYESNLEGKEDDGLQLTELEQNSLSALMGGASSLGESLGPFLGGLLSVITPEVSFFGKKWQ